MVLQRKGIYIPLEPAKKSTLIVRTLLGTVLLSAMLLLIAGTIIYLLVHGVNQ